MEEIIKNAIDPFFYAGNIKPLKEKYPKVPDLPWADKVTKKELPKWFVFSKEKVPIIKDHTFELIFSKNKFLYNIPHQKYILNNKKVIDLGIRFLWFKNKDFFYPFGLPRSFLRSKSPVKARSRSKSPVKARSRSKSPVKSKSKSKK
jgi:hypothetical protein